MTERRCERGGGPGRASRPPGLQAVDGRVSHPARGGLTFRAVGSRIPFRWPEPGQTGTRNPLPPQRGIRATPTPGVPDDRAALQTGRDGTRVPPSRATGAGWPGLASRASGPAWDAEPPSTPVRDLSADEWVGASKWWHKLRTAVTSDPGGATGATTFQRKARFEPYDREAAEAQMSGLERQNGGTGFERP